MKKKILIIDDEPDILRLTVIRLKNSGYEIFQAPDGEEALALLDKNSPDLILLAMILPGIQGGGLCKKLRADAKFKDIPVILFTASVMGVAEITKETGAQDYITKPFEPEQLLYKIKRLTENPPK